MTYHTILNHLHSHYSHTIIKYPECNRIQPRDETIYSSVFHCLKTTQNIALILGSHLIPSSDETANPKTQLIKNVVKHNIIPSEI
jgi:hypothetical protein